MLPFSVILAKAEEMKMINSDQLKDLTGWLTTPWTWVMRRGAAVTGAEN